MCRFPMAIVAAALSLLLVLSGSFRGSVLAQQTFGTATEIAHVLAAADFDSANSGIYSITLNPTTGAFVRSGGGDFFAGLRLPAGAVVTRLEIAGCDASPTGELSFILYRSEVPPGTGARVVAIGLTGMSATPGCARFSVTLPSPPLVIDNANATYWVTVGAGGTTTFDSVRVYYTLQVSPAPASASFSDVPTSHPFFQYIEALRASGITVGCTATTYCPDAPLTRGQMAVFLSKALGLHFAP